MTPMSSSTGEAESHAGSVVVEGLEAEAGLARRGFGVVRVFTGAASSLPAGTRRRAESRLARNHGRRDAGKRGRVAVLHWRYRVVICRVSRDTEWGQHCSVFAARGLQYCAKTCKLVDNALPKIAVFQPAHSLL
jgi:hypothetical protein